MESEVGRRACSHYRCAFHRGLHRAFIVLLVSFLGGPEAFGRVDPPAWTEAEDLVQKIQIATPTLSEKERKQFQAGFSDLKTEHAQLESEEKTLVMRLSADRDDLKKHAQDFAEYEKDRSTWQDRLADHNAQCKRTFTDPADVARCDKSGAKLAKEQEALDARESALAKLKAELKARQAGNVSAVGKFEERYAAWTKNLEPGFNAPLRKALARKVGTTTLRLTVKSFIKVIDLSSMSAESRPRAEKAFAWFTNQNFSEDPKTWSPNAKDYRLWSQATAVVTCRGDVIASWKTSHLAHRSGKELRVLDAETSVLEALKVDPAPQGNDEQNSLTLSYGIRGKPNDAALSSFHIVAPRTCHSIWHRTRATVTCRDGAAQMGTALTGSRFPSHRVWVNDEVKQGFDQGPFSKLWDCDPAAPDRVR
ncbi:MAG TPA: hypothetical protein VJS66_01745 [Burkholderiales bacterium]|nr:hypothetical protein [Burkholderiales bacterium]